MDIEAVIDAVTKFLNEDGIIETLIEVVDLDVLLEEVDEEEIKEYVVNSFDCEDVYDEETLNNWWHENHEVWDYIDWSDVSQQVAENNTPDELYGSEYMFEYFADNYEYDLIGRLRDAGDPEDVYTPEQLAEWAEENGYKKVEVVDESN